MCVMLCLYCLNVFFPIYEEHRKRTTKSVKIVSWRLPALNTIFPLKSVPVGDEEAAIKPELLQAGHVLGTQLTGTTL